MKRISVIIIMITLGIITFSKNIQFTYKNNGDLRTTFDFTFEATDLYVAGLSFYIDLKAENFENNIEVSELNKVLKYLDFSQPGFSIKYKYKNPNFDDYNYFKWVNESFIITFENAFYKYPVAYVVSNGMLGLNLYNGKNNFYYWINSSNFSELAIGYYYNGSELKVGFFSNSINKKYNYGIFLVVGNTWMIGFSKEEIDVEIINKNINLKYTFLSKNENNIYSEFFNINSGKFEINIPIIKDRIYFTILPKKVYGITFNLEM
ncbi:hypothetical protein Marpi_1635 [Marinitoga piezophila KA3]|uniref:Uncharacterized protein n=1 Tax=Marinitoga piezophila (strain DSM 14283 / JCM 11233 / KA3) TaxID=443254 RepID=H2J507_MARPK|nr:hypothetical protein [Marinitoga piezophila]AEX86024.1 hypothetical protein Marpi_1635 [Marinitoga piezophila KA3]